MLTGWIMVSCSLLLLFLLFLWSQGKLVSLLEFVSLFSFRLAIALLFLFLLNILGGYLGLEVPINLFSASIIALLGVPGIFSVGLINYFL